MSENEYKELTITKIFNAPVSEVYRAWTDPIVVAKWWGPDGVTSPECDIDLQIGGKIRIVMLAGEGLGPMAGQRWPMEGEFTEIKDGKKLVFKNKAVDESGKVLIDGQTTVTFDDEDGKTKLTMTTVAKAVSEESVEMIKGMNTGWTESIDKLEKLLR